MNPLVKMSSIVQYREFFLANGRRSTKPDSRIQPWIDRGECYCYVHDSEGRPYHNDGGFEKHVKRKIVCMNEWRKQHGQSTTA